MVEKTFKVIVSPIAKVRLKKIYSYYKENVSLEVARKIRNALLDEADTLKKRPESKALLRMKKRVVPPYRYIKKWSYKIIFQVFENEDFVSVVDFMHDRENPNKKEDL